MVMPLQLKNFRGTIIFHSDLHPLSLIRNPTFLFSSSPLGNLDHAIIEVNCPTHSKIFEMPPPRIVWNSKSDYSTVWKGPRLFQSFHWM